MKMFGSSRTTVPWLFAVSAALTIFIGMAVVRVGLGLDTPEPAFLGIVLLLLSCPPPLLGERRAETGWLVGGLLMLGTLSFGGVGAVIGPVMSVAGAACFGWRLREELRHWKHELLGPIAAGFLLGGWAFLTSMSYHPPWYELALSRGLLSVDVLFHASIGNMIGNYGVASTGVDGIPPVPYHIGSHLLLLGVSKATGVDLIRAYMLGFPVVFIPLFLSTLTRFIAACRRLVPSGTMPQPVYWLLVAILLFGVAPPVVASMLGSLNHVVYLSESYLVGLLLGIEAGTLLLGRQPKPSTADVLGAVLLLLLAGLSKISVLAVLGPVTLLAAFVAGVPSRRVVFAAAVVMLGGFLYLVKFHTMTTNEYVVLEPFAHWRFLFGDRMWILGWPHLVVTQFWALVATLLLFKRDRCASRASRLLLVWVWAMVLLGNLPGLLLDIPRGSAHYFLDVSRWFAAAIALGLLAEWLTAQRTWARRVLLGGMTLVCVANAAFATYVATIGFNEAMAAPEVAANLLDALREAAETDAPEQTAIWVEPEDAVSISENPRWNTLLVPAVSGLAAICQQPSEDVGGSYGFAYFEQAPCVPTGAERAQQFGFRYLVRVGAAGMTREELEP